MEYNTHGTYSPTARARGLFAHCLGKLTLRDKLFPPQRDDTRGASTHNTRPVHTSCNLWPCRTRAVYKCTRDHYVCWKCARNQRLNVVDTHAHTRWNGKCDACNRTTTIYRVARAEKFPALCAPCTRRNGAHALSGYTMRNHKCAACGRRTSCALTDGGRE